MVFILKVNNTQEKKFELHCLRVPVQFLINTVRKWGNTNAESKTMQISQIMKNCDWLINVNRNIDQNQLGATPCWREDCILNFFPFSFVVNTFFLTFYSIINVLDYFYFFIHCGLCFILLFSPRFWNIHLFKLRLLLWTMFHSLQCTMVNPFVAGSSVLFTFIDIMETICEKAFKRAFNSNGC